MRASLSVIALLVTVASCSMPQGSAYSPGAANQPLRAYITGPDFGGLGFQVSRPAHVALFEVVPGRGTSLIYPRAGMGSMSGHTTMGRFNLGLSRVAGRELYHPAHTSIGLAPPRFFFLIASDRPLNLDRFGSYGMGTMRALGTHFAAYNAFSTMEQLVQLSLPGAEVDGSWTTDVYMYWPQATSSDPAPRHVLLTCNGYQVYVRLEYLALVQQSLCATRSEAPEAEPGDSTGTPSGEVIPRRRAPPETDRQAVSEQVRTSAQLEEGRRMRERRTLDRREAAAAERQGRTTREADNMRSRPGVDRHPAHPGNVQGGEVRERAAPASARPDPGPAREPQHRPPPEPRAPAPEPSARPEPAPSPSPSPSPERCRDC